MARTKAEIRAFLDSQVGKSVNAKSAPYQGQCVSLIKALLEFLGAPNPYAARGNAKDFNDTLLRQGIAANGKGWLTVVVNRDMGYIGGVRYGHIWVDLKGEANYEQNGNRALYTTKNTRPISQGQQFVNLDKYIKEDVVSADKATVTEVDNVYLGVLGRHVDDSGKKTWTGKPINYIVSKVRASAEFKNRDKKAKGYDALAKENADLKKKLAAAATVNKTTVVDYISKNLK